ncbi:MAG TPA: hypothetical protein PKI41_11755 [Candidatus Competibacteraceae bacterium]|nr:MAG: hypothetical protein EKK71_10140 [Candidatus Competibacteraceae bacterium]HOB62775.1 hypothetical protein [Candidatus Competibacteraceae bacterium]HQA25880.1 hypothetical protein [Candidatus Competibacteraceae bacterium]HQD57052.1 hypothetical protein [Candidatus Competibacteraceae bacterium]
MRYGNGIWMVLLGLFAVPALAANKCVDAGGRISYQEAPCPAATHGGDMKLNVNRSVSGQAKPPPTGMITITLPDNAEPAAPKPPTLGEQTPDQPPKPAGEPPQKAADKAPPSDS